MLMMNNASMLKIDIVKGKIKEWKIKKSMIPGGFTKYLQPLDVPLASHSRMSWRRGTQIWYKLKWY